MNKNLQRQAYEAFVRSGASPVPPSEVEKPLADGSYRTSAANAGWVFWQAAQAGLQQKNAAPAAQRTGKPMFTKMMTWWSGRGEKIPAFRIPKGVTLNTTDDDSTPLLVPTRFVSSGARERFCAALLDAQKSSRKQ